MYYAAEFEYPKLSFGDVPIEELGAGLAVALAAAPVQPAGQTQLIILLPQSPPST